MKKSLLLCMMMVVGGQVSFPHKIPSLNSLTAKKIFTFKNDQEKQAFNQKLIKGKVKLLELKFEGVTLENMDLSGMYLKGIDFSGCRFIRVNLKNTDLTKTRWDRVKLDHIKWLKGATLYMPDQIHIDCFNRLKGLGKASLYHDQALIVDVDDSYELVKKYSDLRLQIRKKNFDDSDPEVKVLFEKAECLNKIIGSLKNFQCVYSLSNMDITGIRLIDKNQTIRPNIKIEGVWLSKETQLSSTEDNRTNPFEKWASDVEGYQLLWNMGFNLIIGVDSKLVRRTLEEKVKSGVDLSNGFLIDAELQGAHLEKAKLKNANLEFANLQGAHLENANLKNADLYGANLREAWLSEKEQVPDYLENNRTNLFEKWASGIKEYQPLWNAKFDLIKGVDPGLVRRTLEEKVKSRMDLRNGWLHSANLQGAHLKKANLKNADLGHANLRKAHLEKAKLKNAYLGHANLQEAHLENANLKNASLYSANLQEAHLENANLKKVNLGFANLREAHLENAKLKNARLYDANLQGSHLKGTNLRGTNLRGARLSWEFILPYYNKEEELIGVYNACQDQEAKGQLRHILIGKGLVAKDF